MFFARNTCRSSPRQHAQQQLRSILTTTVMMSGTCLWMLVALVTVFSLMDTTVTTTNAFVPSLSSSSSHRHHDTSPLFGLSLSHNKIRRPSFAPLRMVDNDDEADDEEEDSFDGDEVHDGPLSKGVDSVSWLPTVSGATSADDDENPKITHENAEILPLFPLGGIVYTPNSEHVLNIFEPRYRQMYTDILMNGSKRFVVSMSHPSEAGRFAQTGVLFELQELKEVSEQTGDQIKYICNHKVTGRVHMHRVINPSAWENRDTYLRVEGTIMDDSDKANAALSAEMDDDDEDDDEDDSKNTNNKGNDVYRAVAKAASSLADGFKNSKYRQEERAVREAFFNLVELQYETKEDVRFTRGSVPSLPLKDGPGEDGLWQTIKLWQNFAEQRLMARQNELQQDFQEKLRAFLKKERGLKTEKELPSVIGFQDLSPALREEVKELQGRMVVELQPLVLESTLTMQKILEAKDHGERLKLFLYFLQAESKRLETKKTLTGMFKSSSSDDDKDDHESGATSVASSSSKSSSSSTTKMPREEQLLDEDVSSLPAGPAASSSSSSSSKSAVPPPPSPSSSSIFTDEEDAFQ